MEPDQIEKFKRANFKIIVAWANLNELLRRKQNRGDQLNEGRIKRTTKNSQQLAKTFEEINHLIDLKLDLNRLDTDQAIELVLNCIKK